MASVASGGEANASNRRRQAAELTEQLFPEGEESTIGALSDRMRHSLATIASEISLSGSGLRNAAALFFPEEGNFTKAVAEDLESIREWSKDRLANTALATVLSNNPPNVGADDHVNVMPLGERGMLTDHQLDAAEAALEQGLTVTRERVTSTDRQIPGVCNAMKVECINLMQLIDEEDWILG